MKEKMAFPRCGLSLKDVISVAASHKTKKATANKLGVSETQLGRIIKKHALEYLFDKPAGEILCGITAADILRTSRKAANMSDAARMLRVSQGYFARKMNDMGAVHYFANRKVRKRRVSQRSIIKLARQGYTRRDTAYLLGISPAYLKDLIALWHLADNFVVNRGKASWVTRRGYCQ